MGLRWTRDRCPFPAIRLMNYADIRHFGGALQTDQTLPKNYVSMSSSYDASYMPNIVSRILYTTLEGGAVSKNILDFTFLLEGEQDDELPERALGTIRLVHVESNDVALPISFSSLRRHVQSESQNEGDVARPTQFRIADVVTETLQDLLTIMGTPLRAVSNPLKTSADNISDGSDAEQVKSEEFDDALNYVDSTDPFELAANEITGILSSVIIPVRKAHLEENREEDNFNATSTVGGKEDMVSLPVLELVGRNDIKRFYRACNCDLKVSAVRIVETAAWRGMTFPIDRRKCRIELQNGQFFQQGFDLKGNPVYYFRNMCLGPWRKDVNAVIASVLHRFDTSLQEFAKTNEAVRCTAIILMGRPYGGAQRNTADSTGDKNKGTESNQENEESKENNEDDGSTTSMSQGQSMLVSNPRIASGETWQIHTNRTLILRLTQLLSDHYPERLANILLVRGIGKNSYYATNFKARAIVRSLLPSAETRSKVKIISNPSDLHDFVAESELATIVGGTAPIHSSVFECT